MSDFGICDLSIVPVRSEPADQAEQVTQLLFGEAIHILEYHSSNRWVKIKVAFDGYEGWIDPKQFYPVSEDFFLKMLNSQHHYASFGVVKSSHHAWPILLGSVLPFMHEMRILLDDRVLQFEGNTASYSTDLCTRLAFNYLGAPYLWGGKSQFGIDCSGFTQQVYRMCGVRLPRDAYQQAELGKEIQLSEDFNPGDLGFFANPEGRVIHVGIMLDGNRIIHAHGEVKISHVDATGILDDRNDQHTHFWHNVKRFF